MQITIVTAAAGAIVRQTYTGPDNVKEHTWRTCDALMQTAESRARQ